MVDTVVALLSSDSGDSHGLTIFESRGGSPKIWRAFCHSGSYFNYDTVVGGLCLNVDELTGQLFCLLMRFKE